MDFVQVRVDFDLIHLVVVAIKQTDRERDFLEIKMSTQTGMTIQKLHIGNCNKIGAICILLKTAICNNLLPRYQ